MTPDLHLRKFLFQYAMDTYGTQPEYLWEKSPDNAILRHKENGKWYAVVLDVHEKKLGLPGDGTVDVLNVKCDPLEIGSLLRKKGFFPAYHMNKNHWISILLDGSVPEEEILYFLDESYGLTG
ncbi:MmcQ/YjbR family DNA-binding protein [uncultured Ruminococcus sp.]|uniref:MmcQ/YjbR family DNA-binding protein n=1 Tax=uncultured Ruminococcus sp. TaxID=165186 RepID=UPI002637EA96|nr:MmcQ/YjbR family DNA-binding protein [uncultured Ruminococcus sp.]